MTEETKDQPVAPKAPRPKIPRQAMPEQNAKQRAKNFEQVTTGYTEEQAQLEAARWSLPEQSGRFLAGISRC